MKKSSKLSQEKKLRSISLHLELQDTISMLIIIHIMNVKWIRYNHNAWNLSVFRTYINDLAFDFLELIKHIQASQKINADIESYSADEFMILFLIMQIYGFILKQNQASLIHQIP